MCECCYCCCTAHFCEQFGITCGLICGGVVAYMTGSMVIIECCQLCFNPYRRHEVKHIWKACSKPCQICCKKCKSVVRKKKNVVITPVEPPDVHVMVRNPNNTFQLGIMCT